MDNIINPPLAWSMRKCRKRKHFKYHESEETVGQPLKLILTLFRGRIWNPKIAFISNQGSSKINLIRLIGPAAPSFPYLENKTTGEKTTRSNTSIFVSLPEFSQQPSRTRKGKNNQKQAYPELNVNNATKDLRRKIKQRNPLTQLLIRRRLQLQATKKAKLPSTKEKGMKKIFPGKWRKITLTCSTCPCGK